MIGYETYCRIRQFHQERGLSFSQIARELSLDPETVAKYAALATFPPGCYQKGPSALLRNTNGADPSPCFASSG